MNRHLWLGVLAVLAAAPVRAAEPCGDLLIVLDRSGSMVKCTIGGITKEAIAKTALNAVIRSNPAIAMGLWVYPDTLTVCMPGSGCNPGVEVVPLAAGGGPKVSSYLATMPTSCGGTPTGATMQRVKTFSGWTGAKTHHVLLLTDGVPTCDDGDSPGGGGSGACNGLGCEECKNPTKVYDALRDMLGRGIKTFVVGFDADKAVCPAPVPCTNLAPQAPGTLNKDTLNRMAEEGGAPLDGPVRFYRANDAASLSDALDTILGKISGSTVGGCAASGQGGSPTGTGGSDGQGGGGQDGIGAGGDDGNPTQPGRGEPGGCACSSAATASASVLAALLALAAGIVRRVSWASRRRPGRTRLRRSDLRQ